MKWKAETILFILVVVLIIGMYLGIYCCVPEFKEKVDNQIIAWQIEWRLKEKYGVEFDVTSVHLEDGHPYGYSIRYPVYEGGYTFYARFEEETGADSEEGETNHITGAVDDDMQIVADSYPYFMYEKEMPDVLMETVQGVLSNDNAVAINGMFADRVMTLTEDAFSFETFFTIHIHTSQCIYWWMKHIRMSKCRQSEEEREVVKECGAESIYYQEDEIDEKLSVVDADDKYYHINYWREELEYAEDVYLWYKEIDGDVYNSDLLDEIFKTAEN